MRGLVLVAAGLGAASAATMPLAVSLPPRSKRCVHEDFPAKSDGTVELFVESGGRLEVHLTVEGPMGSTDSQGVPQPGTETGTILDEVVTNGHGQEEEFDDSYLFSFKSDGGVYRACVANDMNHVVTKVVQIDIRSSFASPTPVGEPIKLLSSGAREDLSEEEKKAKKRQDADVATLQESIRRIKGGLKTIERQQKQDRHRQAVHTAVNEDNNNHMVIGSLIETVVFIGAAAFQIIFVRNWFENKQAKTWA